MLDLWYISFDSFKRHSTLVFTDSLLTRQAGTAKIVAKVARFSDINKKFI